MNQKMLIWVMILSLGSGTAAAHCSDKRFYGGGGIGLNSSSGHDDAAGFQFFGGYCLPIEMPAKTGARVEAGMWHSGDFSSSGSSSGFAPTAFAKEDDDDDGGGGGGGGGANAPSPGLTTTSAQTNGADAYTNFWLSGVGEVRVASRANLLGRIGYAFGENSGPMAGFGVGLNITRYAQVRGEYIVREDTQSVLLNVLSEF